MIRYRLDDVEINAIIDSLQQRLSEASKLHAVLESSSGQNRNSIFVEECNKHFQSTQQTPVEQNTLVVEPSSPTFITSISQQLESQNDSFREYTDVDLDKGLNSSSPNKPNLP